MFLELRELLTPDEVTQLREIAARAKFVDGRQTNPDFKGKDNLQIDQLGAEAARDYAASSKIVLDAFNRSFEFREFTQAKRIVPPILAKYTPGMKYGAHADVAFMPTPQGPLRSDISCTVFLNNPGEYDGGELVIHLGDRSLPIKCAAGAALVYPSTTLHEVAPVRRGERLVAITFIESHVVSEQDRWMLFELADISSLEGNVMSEPNRMRLEVVRYNLIRRWSTN